jgi:predicted nicotinamide N-methyase
MRRTGSGEIDTPVVDSGLMPFVTLEVELPGGELSLLQPGDAADLPDDGPIEWAPVVPYWSVLWRSGVALARELAEAPIAGMRVLELGCGLGVPSLAAARAGARVLATDEDPEALELLERNARESGIAVETARVDWRAADELAARAPFDLVIAADVLYEPDGIQLLVPLLPRLGAEVWLADPGREVADAFFELSRGDWSVETKVRDGIEIHRLTTAGRPRTSR